MFNGLKFKVADGAEQVRALEMRRRVYEQEFAHHGIDTFDEEAQHLIASDDQGDIVAALRVIGPEQRPLEIEQYVDLSNFIAAERFPGQIGGLWVWEDHPAVKRNPLISMGLMKIAYAVARERRITDLVMKSSVVRLRKFYQRAHFRPIDSLTFEHPAWGMVYVMHLDLIDLERRVPQDPVTRFLLATDNPDFHA